MTGAEIIELVKTGGGYGFASVMYYFLRQEKEERIRYRNFHEATLKQLSNLPETLKELTDAVKNSTRQG